MEQIRRLCSDFGIPYESCDASGGDISTSDDALLTTNVCCPTSSLQDDGLIMALFQVRQNIITHLTKQKKKKKDDIIPFQIIRAPLLLSLKTFPNKATITTLHLESESMLETIVHDRRITDRNSIRWIQEISASLISFFRQYNVIVGTFGLEEISLFGDDSFLNTFQKLHTLLPNLADGLCLSSKRHAWFNNKMVLKLRSFHLLRLSDKHLTGSIVIK